ncbi:aminotransferase class III-fold pyridoxal phosphate-dependent enzyme, partial [Azospirillum sp. B4]|uniref:aminotransferase class III-fold pyridoxal phosphate-dependent enzyme n=1 Tax=Azospirillum sp. B4 TaxID=95605 RepID=UPI0005CB3599
LALFYGGMVRKFNVLAMVWLKAMRAVCTELDILLVADEVITGFCRTGPLFACESEGVTPDLMTVAKG